MEAVQDLLKVYKNNIQLIKLQKCSKVKNYGIDFGLSNFNNINPNKKNMPFNKY